MVQPSKELPSTIEEKKLSVTEDNIKKPEATQPVDIQSDSSYRDDFESSFANTESQLGFDASVSHNSASGLFGTGRARHHTVKHGKSTDTLDEDDHLLAEGRDLHQQQEKKQRRRERRGDKQGSKIGGMAGAPPIKEEDTEAEEFDDADSADLESNTNSK